MQMYWGSGNNKNPYEMYPQDPNLGMSGQIKITSDNATLKWERIAYELFELNADGKAFLEMLTQDFILKERLNPAVSDFQTKMVFLAGRTEFILFLRGLVENHQKRSEMMQQQGIK